MKSETQGAYEYAHVQYEKALDAYSQSDYETSLLQKQVVLAGALVPILEKAAELLPTLKECPKDSHACAAMLSVQSQARKLLDFSPPVPGGMPSSSGGAAASPPPVPNLPLSSYSTTKLLLLLSEPTGLKIASSSASLLKLLPDELAAKKHALDAVAKVYGAILILACR